MPNSRWVEDRAGEPEGASGLSHRPAGAGGDSLLAGGANGLGPRCVGATDTAAGASLFQTAHLAPMASRAMGPFMTGMKRKVHGHNGFSGLHIRFFVYIDRGIYGGDMKPRVLFLCSANSARSQMAEVLLRHFGGERFDAFSAGTEPSEVDPRTLEALKSFGLAAQGLVSKSIETFCGQHFDYVISLCDKAHRECRHWPGSGVVLAWDFPDPKASNDPKAFERTLQEISERVRLFLLVNSKEVSSEVSVLQPLAFYKALADETRLLSLLLIEQEGELCVCELMAALDLPQPKISRHLRQLRKAGLLLDRRRGQWVFYRLHPLLHDWMRDVLRQTRTHAPGTLQRPLARLKAMGDRPGRGGNACGTALAGPTT